jgi:cell division protein FtsX
MTTRYVIQRVSLGSAGKFGLALGLLGSLLPGCLLAFLTRLTVATLRQALEAATQSRFSILGQSITLNLVDLAHLAPTLEALRGLDAMGWLLAVAVAVACTVLGGLFIAVTVLLLAMGFNVLATASGGLEFQVSETGRRGA